MRAFCVLDVLESRRLLSATLDSTGLLTVAGTNSNDTTTVILKRNRPGRLNVIVGTTLSEFDTAAVTGLSIRGRRGNDLIQINPANGAITIPNTIFGEAGDDTLIGGQGRDRF